MVGEGLPFRIGRPHFDRIATWLQIRRKLGLPQMIA